MGCLPEYSNLSLSQAVVPYKRLDTSNLNDFRPVALTPVAMMCLEKTTSFTRKPPGPGHPPVCLPPQLISGRHGSNSSTPHLVTPGKQQNVCQHALPVLQFCLQYHPPGQADREADSPNSHLQLDSGFPGRKTTGWEDGCLLSYQLAQDSHRANA